MVVSNPKYTCREAPIRLLHLCGLYRPFPKTRYAEKIKDLGVDSVLKTVRPSSFHTGSKAWPFCSLLGYYTLNVGPNLPSHPLLLPLLGWGLW